MINVQLPCGHWNDIEWRKTPSYYCEECETWWGIAEVLDYTFDKCYPPNVNLQETAPGEPELQEIVTIKPNLDPGQPANQAE